MKKLLAVSLLGAAVVGTVVVARAGGVGSSPEAKTCVKLNDLCAVDDESRRDLATCESDLKWIAQRIVVPTEDVKADKRYNATARNSITADRSTTSCFQAERPEQWPTRSKRDLANFWQSGFL